MDEGGGGGILSHLLTAPKGETLKAVPPAPACRIAGKDSWVPHALNQLSAHKQRVWKSCSQYRVTAMMLRETEMGRDGTQAPRTTSALGSSSTMDLGGDSGELWGSDNGFAQSES